MNKGLTPLRGWAPTLLNMQVEVIDANTVVTTGDGKKYLHVPRELHRARLVRVGGAVITVSSSGTPTIQIANVTSGFDLLLNKIVIDINKRSTDAAAFLAIPPTVDTVRAMVNRGDVLRFDVDVAGTGTKGFLVDLVWQLAEP